MILCFEKVFFVCMMMKKIDDFSSIECWDVIFPYENQEKSQAVMDRLNISLDRLAEILKHIL